MPSPRMKFAIQCIVYLILFMRFQDAHCETYSEFILSSLPILCPYTDFCTFPAVKKLKYKKVTPCCKPCSCGRDCLVNGNCCLDSPAILGTTSPSPSATQCSPPLHFEYDDFEMDVGIDELVHYYITATCLKDYSDEDAIQKCLNPELLVSLEDRVMVSDTTGRVFYNRYCAECNGVRHYKTWDLQLLCKQFSKQFRDVYNTKDLNDNRCLVMSSPPTEALALSSRCYPIQYGKCNITGRWKTFDARIERACKSTTNPYLQEGNLFSTLYKNVYCYMCNKDEDDTIANRCFFEDSGRTGSSLMFSALIQGTFTKSTSHKIAQGPICNVKDIFDHHFGKCRPLQCPLDSIPLYGKCVNIFKKAIGMQIKVMIEAEYANDYTKGIMQTHSTNLELRNQMESIANSISADIGLEGNSCDKCTSLALPREDHSGTAFLFSLQTSKACSMSVLTNLLGDWGAQRTHMSMELDRQQLAFKVQIAYGYPDMISHNDPRFSEEISVWYSPKACTRASIYLMPKFYCPHLDISSNDYKHVLLSNGKHPRQSDFIAVKDGVNEGNATRFIYRICVDKYLPKNNTSVVAVQSMGLTCIAIVVSVILSVLC